MSFSLNRTMVAGNVTRDPEIRNVGEKAVCNFGIAINRRFKNKAGELKEEVLFLDIEAWGKTAEFAQRFLPKGTGVYAEGRLKMESWDDKSTGQKRSKILLVAEQLTFTTAKKDDGEAAPKAMAASASGRPAPTVANDDSFEPPF